MNPTNPEDIQDPVTQPPQTQMTPPEAPVPEVPIPTSTETPTLELKVKNPLSVMQPGEQVICEITRHPIGLIGTYVTSGFIILVLALLAFWLVPVTVASADNRAQIISLGALAFLVLSLFVVGFALISRTVYKGNRWIVTSDSLTQITQTSLFDKKSSQLSLANLEDITASQDGVLSHMYKYGSLTAETAGERSKFRLLYCPDPNHYAQCILDAREKFEQLGGRRGEQ